MTVNHGVVGSSPTGGAMKKAYWKIQCAFFSDINSWRNLLYVLRTRYIFDAICCLAATRKGIFIVSLYRQANISHCRAIYYKKQLPEKEFSDPLVRVVLSYSVTSRGICVPNLKATILIKPAHFASDFFIFPHLCGIQTGICHRFLQKRGKNPILPNILFALRFLIRAGVCATEALRRSCCADHFCMLPAAYRKRR